MDLFPPPPPPGSPPRGILDPPPARVEKRVSDDLPPSRELPKELPKTPIHQSLAILQETLHETAETPIIDEVVRIIEKQLDPVVFPLLWNDDYLVQVIRDAERPFFRRKHRSISVLSRKVFLSFDIDIENHVETRSVEVVRTPFKGQSTRTRLSDLESLNARFPQKPFRAKETSWIRAGSDCQTVCIKCSGMKTTNCATCGGLGDYTDSCPECGGTGQTTRWLNQVSTEAGQLLDGKLNVRVGRYEAMANCPSCRQRGQVRKTCSECKGKGKHTCSDCSGTGSQFYFQKIITTTTITGMKSIVPENVPPEWIRQVKPSEKIVVQDYLPGKTMPDDNRTEVTLQRVSISVVPSVECEVQADNENATVFILNNHVFSKHPTFGYSSGKLALVLLPLLFAALWGYISILKDSSMAPKQQLKSEAPAIVVPEKEAEKLPTP